MGTSKAYKGRSDTGRLLPPEAQQPSDEVPQKASPQETPAEDTPQDEKPQDEKPLEKAPRPEITFEQTRRVFNKLVSGLRGGAAIGAGGGVARVARDYVRASGGARTAALAGPSGRTGARNLGGFLGAVARDGLGAAVARFNVQTLAGLPPDVVLARLLDALLPGAATREAVLARSCLANALERWLERHDVEGRGIEALENTSSTEIPELMELYLVEYVHDRMLNEIVDWAERTQEDATAQTLSDGLREYIENKLERHLEEHADTFEPVAWLDRAEEVADQLFDEVFGLLEELPDDAGNADEEGGNE